MAETLEASEEAKRAGSPRADIDTSAPFESVKEAVNRFGGIGFWKPSSVAKISKPNIDAEALDIVKLEEQALFLEKDLIAKEREALDVLKELESTKKIVEELKQKLQKETSEVNLALEAKNLDEADKENHGDNEANRPLEYANNHRIPSSAPGLILMELKQAKVNLSRTTTDLADIRSSVDSFNKKLENERLALEKTRERLTRNTSQISSLEGELSATKLKLELAREAKKREEFENPTEISKELHRLSSEVEEFKRVGEAARSEVQRATREIEDTKRRIRTAETRLIAARKTKEAARAAEAFALAEIKGVSESGADKGASEKERVTLSFEDYSSLVLKAREAEELSLERVEEAMKHVQEVEISKTEILRKVDEATEEVRTSKRVLEEALSQVEAANQGKLAVEEALRRWRSDRHISNNKNAQRRRSNGSSIKFKNQLHHRRDPRLIDVNGLRLVSDGSVPVLKPTLSIGQILSRKLLSPPEETGTRSGGASRPKVSLGQMLRRHKGDHHRPSSSSVNVNLEKESNSCGGGNRKQFSGKRKKFGFSRISLLLAKQSKKKKTSLR